MIIDFSSDSRISDGDRLAIARIIYAGFEAKIGGWMNRVQVEAAIIILSRAITFDMGFYLKEDGVVKAAALLSNHQTGFMRFDKQARYQLGWRNWLLLKLALEYPRSSKRKGLKLEMIAVAPSTRGQGIGQIMLDYLDARAQAEGYAKVSLDVTDTNEKAKQLYERRGFETIRYYNIRLLSHGKGFNGYYLMSKTLPH